MKIEDYIVVFEGVLLPEVCDQILQEYCQSDDWRDSRVGVENKVNRDIRAVSVVAMSAPEIISRNPDYRKQLDTLVFNGVSEVIIKYTQRFPYSKIEEDSGYDLLRYEEGEFYLEHVDSVKKQPRSISCSLVLNDDYEGGEFAFFGRDIKIKAPKGAALVFPSNFMYPHEIMSVTKGTRYSIVTWLI